MFAILVFDQLSNVLLISVEALESPKVRKHCESEIKPV